MFLVRHPFALQGIIYNVPPLRTKDQAYLDVITESVNNPFCLMIGWAMVDPTTLPPFRSSPDLLDRRRVSHGGEASLGFREIVASHGREMIERYRISFARLFADLPYVSCFVYALFSSFFLAVFSSSIASSTFLQCRW